MAYTLSDGRPVSFDLNQVTRKEFSDFSRGRLTDDQDNELLARVSGLTAEQIENLPQPEFRRFLRAFYQAATEPLADPN